MYVTDKILKNDRIFATKWGIPIEERQRNMSLYGTWIYENNVTIIPDKKWPPLDELNQTLFDRFATMDLDKVLQNTPIYKYFRNRDPNIDKSEDVEADSRKEYPRYDPDSSASDG